MVPAELTAGPRFGAFCQHYVRQTKGRWGGVPLQLEAWQREFWWEALEVDPITGLRVYQEVGLGIPRKNGKSTMASAAGHYFLVADGENEPEVYVAAAARNQAGIVLGQARTMALRSPRLLEHVLVRRYHLECPKNGGIMRSLSSDAALQHGLNPSANLVDELHAHKSPDLYTALTTGTGARDQPITIWISTAGVAGEGILADLYASMFGGTGELESRNDGALLIYRDRANGVLIWWYGAPRDADIDDPALWLRVNPASWLQDGHYLRQQHARLVSRGAALEWRMYHLNQFAEYEESWLPDGAWAACLDERTPDGAPLHDLRTDLPIGIGIDRSQTNDAGAIAIAQRQGDIMIVRCEIFGPAGPTGRVDGAAMRERVRALRAQFPVAQARDPENEIRIAPGPAVAYEPVNFEESAELLEGGGVNMIKFPQTDAHMAPATSRAYELITSRRIRHTGDPVLAEHVGASLAKVTERGVRITKLRRGSPRKNVGAVAMVMAVTMASQDPPAPKRRAQVVVSL